MTDALTFLCHHEAAHAAVAHHFRLRLSAVWVNPATDNGQTELSAPEQTRLQHALILAAGAGAQRILDPERAALRIAATMDFIKLRNLVSERKNKRLFGKRPDEEVEQLRERIDMRIIACSRRLVFNHWLAVAQLAREPRTRHRIEGPEAETILAGTGNGQEKPA